MSEYKEWPSALAGTMLILAVFSWSYDYYVLLRIVVTAIAIYCAYNLRAKKDKWWVFIGLALLFNPVVPIYATRGAWFWIDLVGAGIFLTLGRDQYDKKRA